MYDYLLFMWIFAACKKILEITFLIFVFHIFVLIEDYFDIFIFILRISAKIVYFLCVT